MNPVVHLELHTADLRGACATYAQLCGWSAKEVETRTGCYMALGLGERVAGASWSAARGGRCGCHTCR
jgi:predicted enzyme related to lactoylglutathione lyase